MTYLSYNDYLCSLQAVPTTPDHDCIFIGESVLAQHVERFCEGTSNYVISVDCRRRCLVVCHVQKSGECACILGIVELHQPFGVYKLFSPDFVSATEEWFSLVYVQQERGIRYDSYYNGLPIADGSENTLEELNADILEGLTPLGLEHHACIVLCAESAASRPLAYGLQRAFESEVICAKEETGRRLQPSQILASSRPHLHYREANGMRPLELDFGYPYQVVVTPEGLVQPSALLGNQALSDLMDTATINFDFTLGGRPMKYVRVVAESDACNNICIALTVGDTTLRKMLAGGLKPEELHGRWSPVSTKIEVISTNEPNISTQT